MLVSVATCRERDRYCASYPQVYPQAAHTRAHATHTRAPCDPSPTKEPSSAFALGVLVRLRLTRFSGKNGLTWGDGGSNVISIKETASERWWEAHNG
jgi:hypothetical protein